MQGGSNPHQDLHPSSGGLQEKQVSLHLLPGTLLQDNCTPNSSISGSCQSKLNVRQRQSAEKHMWHGC